MKQTFEWCSLLCCVWTLENRFSAVLPCLTTPSSSTPISPALYALESPVYKNQRAPRAPDLSPNVKRMFRVVEISKSDEDHTQPPAARGVVVSTCRIRRGACCALSGGVRISRGHVDLGSLLETDDLVGTTRARVSVSRMPCDDTRPSGDG